MSEPAPKRLEIKKYANRRYYDATHSRHLTLDEIRTLIQQGYDLHVVDARTGADITAQVLTQLILELDTSKLDSLPVPLLVRIIRMNDQLVKDFIEKYFNQALNSFLEYPTARGRADPPHSWFAFSPAPGVGLDQGRAPAIFFGHDGTPLG